MSSNEVNIADFDYSAIPLGYYDHIANEKKGMRSFWHHLKFNQVIDSIEKDASSILDIGCFAGTLLGMIPENRIREQVGIDILEAQIKLCQPKLRRWFQKVFNRYRV